MHAVYRVWLCVCGQSGSQEMLFGCLHEYMVHELKKLLNKLKNLLIDTNYMVNCLIDTNYMLIYTKLYINLNHVIFLFEIYIV